MIPESNIKSAITNTWVEKFPEGDTTSFPKGLIKRISMVAIKNKTGIVSGQYRTRISIVWYDVNPLLFDAKMEAIITAMSGITTDADIANVYYDGREDGYDNNTDMHIMNLDFFVKHNI